MRVNDITRHTYNGQDDNHKVEDVPTNREIMLPKGDDLQGALCGEDNNEDDIDPVQDDFLLLTLLVCLHHHGHHVEADQHHDEDIKKLFGNQVKDQTLELILVTDKKQNKD